MTFKIQSQCTCEIPKIKIEKNREYINICTRIKNLFYDVLLLFTTFIISLVLSF